jgi:acetylornithine deacetylase/succinyl-diaminopimelate desuccinylase-like protein
MPFRPWIRSKPECAQPSLLAEEMTRLAADPRVHRLFEWFSSHERDIAGFQLAITAVPAPPFAEQARAAWLAERLHSLGLVTATDAVGNLLALRPGDQPQPVPAAGPGPNTGLPPHSPAIAVSAHLDTVFPASTPLHVCREQARLLGPGISDNGSGLAALWALASAFQEAGLLTALPLLFIANVGEEGEGNLRGMRHIYREHLPAAAANAPAAADVPAPALALLIALDGTGSESIISQALGSRRFEIVIAGPGGHSWSDHGVPNPIVAAALVADMLFRIPLPVNPRTTLNIGSIEGGTSVNTIPERAILKVDLRSADFRLLDDLEQRLRRVVQDACDQTEAYSSNSRAHLRYAITVLGERPAGELPAASPLLAAIRAVDAHLGIQSQLQRASTDANIPLSLGLEAVSLGSGGSGGGAHTVHEWFDPAGREQALKRLTLLILLLAGLPPGASSRSGPASAASVGPYPSLSRGRVPASEAPPADPPDDLAAPNSQESV